MLLAWIIGTLAVLAALYGLHRILFYLVRGEWLHDWRNASGSGGYNPLLEIYHPQVRHVIQVEEQRLGDEGDDCGAPPNPPSAAAHGE